MLGYQTQSERRMTRSVYKFHDFDDNELLGNQVLFTNHVASSVIVKDFVLD